MRWKLHRLGLRPTQGAVIAQAAAIVAGSGGLMRKPPVQT